MQIPIIIVNWNGVEDSKECIESVLKMEYSGFDIYLLDNGSAGNDADVLKAHFKDETRVHIIRSPENLGFAKGNNLVVEKILDKGYEYVALLNNDTVVDKPWLESLVQVAQDHNAEVVSSKLVNYFDKKRLDNIGHQMLNTGEIIPIAHAGNTDDYNRISENMGSCAAGTLYSTRLIRHLGLFDPYFSTGYEDAELGVRAYVAGYRCMYAPDAVVYHKVGRSIGKVFDERYPAMIQRYIWYSYFKLMPLTVMMLNLPFIVLKAVILIILNLVFLRFKYMRIMFYGWKSTWSNRKEIKRARRAFFQKIKPRSSWQILRQQTFFLGYDLKRFWRVFVRRNASAFDSYGGQ